MAFDYQNILVEKKDRYAIVTINRPDVMNCVDVPTAKEITDAMEQLNVDPEVFGVIITGAGGKSFCAGDDVNDDWSQSPFGSAWGMRVATLPRQRMLNSIEEYSFPVIAAIDGYALGGGLCLALTCDLRIATEKSKFGATMVRLGFHDDWGGNSKLPRVIGEAKAKELYFTGKRISAAEAEKMGMLTQVVPSSEDLLPACEALMAEILKNAPLAIKFEKIALHCGRNMSQKDVMEMESMMDGIVIESQDLKEGLDAFFHKREPKWINK